eukprot:TRINITY_DN73_c0_g1_i3.p1 TRINITY_DN73_c0_g1~~TRINITY_DN73_c0_g1_i3.p1  ORF type:complete len:219 (+),score=57.63 TRINITY_DN73_c0_g1_i3:70-726(+)
MVMLWGPKAGDDRLLPLQRVLVEGRRRLTAAIDAGHDSGPQPPCVITYDVQMVDTSRLRVTFSSTGAVVSASARTIELSLRADKARWLSGDLKSALKSRGHSARAVGEMLADRYASTALTKQRDMLLLEGLGQTALLAFSMNQFGAVMLFTLGDDDTWEFSSVPLCDGQRQQAAAREYEDRKALGSMLMFHETSGRPHTPDARPPSPADEPHAEVHQP